MNPYLDWQMNLTLLQTIAELLVFHLCHGTALLFPDMNLSDIAADVHSKPGKRLID